MPNIASRRRGETVDKDAWPISPHGVLRRYPDVLLEALRLEAGWRRLAEASTLPNKEELLRRSMHFLPALDAFAPHLVEEMRGIADGAHVAFAEVLLINVRAEAAGPIRAEALCTAFAIGQAATATGAVLSGQNLDQYPANRDLMIVLKVSPDKGLPILMCTFGGLVGYPGINANGVSMFQNALSTSTWRGAVMPHYLLKRVLLEQSDAPGALGVLRSADVCSSSNCVLTDRDGRLFDAEATPEGCDVLDPVEDILVHANHFLDPALSGDDVLLALLPDSAVRVPRMEGLLRSDRGRIALDTLKAALSDHAGAPRAICRHEDGVRTIASLPNPRPGYSTSRPEIHARTAM